MKLQLQDIATDMGAELRPREGDPAATAGNGILHRHAHARRREICSSPSAVRRYDAHDFVAAALERGARAAVVARSKVTELLDVAHTHTLLIVDDPLIALQTLAAAVRRHWNKRVIGHNRQRRQDHDQRGGGGGSGRRASRFLNRREISTMNSACPCNCSNWNRSMRWP